MNHDRRMRFDNEPDFRVLNYLYVEYGARFDDDDIPAVLDIIAESIDLAEGHLQTTAMVFFGTVPVLDVPEVSCSA